MKNLRVSRSKEIEFKTGVVGFCIDADNGLLFVFNQNFDLFKAQTHGNKIIPENIDYQLDLHSIGIVSPITRDEIRLIEFIVESGSILIAFKNGQLVRLGISTFSPPSGCIYKHERSLASVKVSPDQDSIILADEENNIYVMSIDGHIMHSSNSLTENDSLHKPVGVGWGSKETQFFGLDGRPSQEQQQKIKAELSPSKLNDIKVIESSDLFKEFNRFKEDKRDTVIVWRGDGQYISTLTYIKDTNKHYLKVWNRNLVLQYMSEQLVDIERGQLTWIPNGQYICCTQRRDSRINDIIMFEKNGMVHQRVTLPTILDDAYISDITWSPDSRILAVLMYQFVINIQNSVQYQPILILYTTQNFHYYIKYSASLATNCNYFLKWDPINHNKLHMVSSVGHYNEYDCNFIVSHCRKESTVAVVDANKVLITPMETCSIPPPMSAIVLEVDALIHQLIVNPSVLGNIFIVTLDNRIIYTRPSAQDDDSSQENDCLTYRLECETAKELFNSLKRYSSVRVDEVQSYRHLTPINEFRLAAVRLCGSVSEIVIIDLPRSNSATFQAPVIKTYSLKDQQVVHISRDNRVVSPTKLGIILADQSTLFLDLDTGSFEEAFRSRSLTANFTLTYCYIDVQIAIKHTGENVLISLGQDSSLRLNSDIIASNSCTSFRLTDNYLIYTTSDNMMHFVLLSNLLDRKSIVDIETCVQPIEMGGTLITASESNSKVILQMPRGNLEILHPRLLVFCALTDLLDKHDYVKAMKLARRHRLNMNLIADYLLYRNPTKTEELNVFANQVASHDQSLLNLFITELSNENTISGRYESILKHVPQRQVDFNKNISFTDKVNKVLSSIKLPEEHLYLNPELLRLLKMNPAQVGKALNLVHNLDEEVQGDALKFMLYFISIDQLFLDSLRTYNTDISLMVASVSNKDPKEYLSLLSNFDKIQNSKYRRFEIDMHVKSYDKALEHLLDVLLEEISDEFNNSYYLNMFVKIVEDKRLYKHALAILYDHQDKLSALSKRIWSNYGDYLLEKRYFTKAGIAFSKALFYSGGCEELLFNSSLKCFKMSGCYEEAAAMVMSSNFDDTFKINTLADISGYLLDRGKCCEGICIMQEGACFSLIREKLMNNRRWYLVEYFARRDCKVEDIRNELKRIEINIIEVVVNMIESWSLDLKRHIEQFERLKQLISIHRARKLDEIDQEGNFVSDSLSTTDGSETCSSVSERFHKNVARSGASSIKTKNSSSTTKSQSTKKKRVNLKTGSRYEDIALILELKNYISNQRLIHHEASEILTALFNYSRVEDTKLGSDGFASKIQSVLSQSLKFSKEVCDLLWPSGTQSEQKYSLYLRFGDILSNSNGNFENLDFEVLIRPDYPRELYI